MIDQYSSLGEKFLKKGIWLYVFGFIIAPMGYIIKIIISNQLSVNEVGIIYGIISLITLISAYNDFGMTESLKYFIPKFLQEKRYDKIKSILFYAFFLQIFTSLLIASFFYFGSDYISQNYFKTEAASDVLKIFAFFFIALNIFQTISNFFLAVQDTFHHKISELLRISITTFLVIFLYFSDQGNIIQYSYTWLIGLYMGVLISLYFLYKKYYSRYLIDKKILFEKDFFIQISKYAFIVLIGASAATLLSQIDMQMIILLLGTKEAGYYTNYLSIVSIPFIIIGPIFGLLFPIFSEMHSKGETEKIQKVKNIFQKNFLILGISFNILFFVFSETIALILFGEKFITSGIILKYSILLLSFNFLLSINFNILSGIGKVKNRVKIICLGIIFNIIANFILILSIGVNGAALATGLGWFVIWLLSERELRKLYQSNFDIIQILKNIFSMSLLSGILYFYSFHFFENSGRFSTLLLFILISTIYFSGFILINYKNFSSFLKQLKHLRRK